MVARGCKEQLISLSLTCTRIEAYVQRAKKLVRCLCEIQKGFRFSAAPMACGYT